MPGIEAINYDIVALCRWAVENNMKINADKTQAIIFGTRRFLNITKNNNLTVLVNGVEVRFAEKIKYLGVMLTETMV